MAVHRHTHSDDPQMPPICSYIQACVEQNVPEGLRLAQNGIDQDNNWVIFNVFVHRLLAGLLRTHTQSQQRLNFTYPRRVETAHNSTHADGIIILTWITIIIIIIIHISPICSSIYMFIYSSMD